MTNGKIISIRGVVIDVAFDKDKTPSVYNALLVKNKEGGVITLEVQSILDEGLVRTVAMGEVLGLSRGSIVTDTGNAIQVPVGSETLGRIFNVLGEKIDDGKDLKNSLKSAIHQLQPSLEDQKVEKNIFETGIKVIDLITPFTKGGKVAVFGGAGVGKTVLMNF